MNQLEKLQRTFQDCVINPDANKTTAWISAKGRAAPAVQLSIYSHAYRARLNEVLANDFPAVLMAVGDDTFNQICTGYMETHPSHYFSLREFGRDMPQYINDLIKNKSLDTEMTWLAELSLFEWSLGQTFDSADDRLFTEQDMAVIPPESWPELTFSLHSSVQRLKLEWNSPEMWIALTDDKPTEITAQQDKNSHWLIWRENFVTRFRSMQTDEQLAFDALAAGENFNDVCMVLADIMDEDSVPMHAAGLLKGWINQGLISERR